MAGKRTPPIVIRKRTRATVKLDSGDIAVLTLEPTVCPPAIAEGALTDRYTAKRKKRDRGKEYAESWKV